MTKIPIKKMNERKTTFERYVTHLNKKKKKKMKKIIN